MPSTEPSAALQPHNIQADCPLLTRSDNGEVFQFLLAFLQMSRGFKLGFVEVNFPPDINELITHLDGHPQCQNIQFALIELDNPDLRFLLETLQEQLRQIDRQPDKKLVLLLRGLEKSIGTTGDYPPIITNLNYTRDSFLTTLPHPTLFLLPDYAVTRIAQFAPDFWAWTSATFKFQAAPATLERVIQQTADNPSRNRTYPKGEQAERIDLLERLLQEYTEDTEASSRARIEVLNQLGSAHRSIREFETAQAYFHQSLELSRELKYLQGEAIALYHLGIISYDLRQFHPARSWFEQSLLVTEQTGDRQSTAKIYHFLGIVAQELREYAEARRNYQLSLEIDVKFGDLYGQASTYGQFGTVAEELREYEEARHNYQLALEIFVKFGDLYGQASVYHNLGIIAQELREYAEARRNYQLSLKIKVEFGDRHSQAITYHNLGIVAEELQEYAEARRNYQLALEIYVEFGDRYSQASTYGQLGLLAEAEENLPEAGANLLQALEIFQQFQDSHSIDMTISNLSRIYAATQDERLLESIAQILGVTVAEVRGRMAA
ncbi:tetratricopeptide repeat protein [Chamaesiphon sp. VAR_69_metabat_338]|uniref:tetratricopeptide repeat protein n=1 Tax=Chamaesiphon sp. VAR_69_metabat_338 TaxID=2964704 RepID=UPI00286E4DF9|nr:tetratricopeptide repeat protein [Chamaesiphon sp. VAR_69_metabat_338]